MLETISNAVSSVPFLYGAAKTIYNKYNSDPEKFKEIYANLEPACFMNMIACMAIAPEDMRPRVTPYATLMIDRNNDIRNLRNGDPDFVYASRNLINAWNRILIIALTIFPPYGLRRVLPTTHIVNTNLQKSIENSFDSQKSEKELNNPSKENSKSKDTTQTELTTQKNTTKNNSKSNKGSAGTDNQNTPLEEVKNKEVSLNNANKENIIEKSKKSSPITNQYDEEFELVEIPSRIEMCKYMINGFNKIIRTYSKIKNGEATVALLKNYITIVEGALKGEKLPPIPDKPVATSVVKRIRATYTDKEFEYVLQYLNEGNEAALKDGFECSTTKSACETIETFTKKIGTEHKKFMNARAFI